MSLNEVKNMYEDEIMEANAALEIYIDNIKKP